MTTLTNKSETNNQKEQWPVVCQGCGGSVMVYKDPNTRAFIIPICPTCSSKMCGTAHQQGCEKTVETLKKKHEKEIKAIKNHYEERITSYQEQIDEIAESEISSGDGDEGEVTEEEIEEVLNKEKEEVTEEGSTVENQENQS